MEKLRRSLGSFIVPLLSILLAFIIGGIIMAALGADPFAAVRYLFQGAFGSKANIGTTLTKATPLIFTSLCACFAYKCGVFNLGGEGQFLMGSIAAFLTAYFSGATGFLGVLLALLAGTLAGGLWGMIPGVLKITRGQNEMIISIMLNYVATLFMGVLYTSWIRDASVPQTPAVDELVRLPRVIPGMRFTWGFVIAVVVGLLLYYVLFWTSSGFKLRAVGYNMTASRFNGIHVKRCMLASFVVSGAAGNAVPPHQRLRRGLRLRRCGDGSDRAAAPHRHDGGGSVLRRAAGGLHHHAGRHRRSHQRFRHHSGVGHRVLRGGYGSDEAAGVRGVEETGVRKEKGG